MFKAIDLIEPKPFWTRRRFAWAWAGIIFAFLIMRVTTLTIPLERDEGEYAYIAQQMLHGAVPYRDAFDQKPPGVFLIYLVCFLIFGQSTMAIHLFMGLWTIASMVLLYRLVSRLSGASAGLLAALCLALMTADRGVIGTAANTEIFFILPMIGSILCIVPKSGRAGVWRLVAAGALGACACWIKQVTVFDLFFIAGWVFFTGTLDRPRIKLSQLLIDQFCIAMGVITVSTIVFAYFAVVGATDDFLFCVFKYNFHYSSTEASTFESMRTNFKISFSRLLAGDWPFWIAMAGGLALLFLKENWRLLGFCVAFFGFSFIGVCIGGYFRPHYYIQILPAVAVLGGIGLAGLFWQIHRRVRFRIGVIIIILILAAMLIIPVRHNANILFAPNPKLASFRIYGPTPFLYSKEVGEDLRSKTSPDDTILVMGTEPQILFYARRRSASRYIFFNPLGAKYDGVLEDQKRALAEIDQNKPKFIVNFMRLYQDTFIKKGVTEPYFFDELGRWGVREGYAPVDFWIERTYEDAVNFPQCYEHLTMEDVIERSVGRETTLPLVIIYARPATAPANP